MAEASRSRQHEYDIGNDRKLPSKIWETDLILIKRRLSFTLLLFLVFPWFLGPFHRDSLNITMLEVGTLSQILLTLFRNKN